MLKTKMGMIIPELRPGHNLPWSRFNEGILYSGAGRRGLNHKISILEPDQGSFLKREEET